MKVRIRRPALWLAVFLFGGLAVSLVAFPAWIRSLEERRWAEMGRRIDELEAQLRSRQTKRVLLRGTPIPGNAWDDYSGLLESLGNYRDYSKAVDFADRPSGSEKEEARRLVAECPTLRDGLRRGASKAEVRLPTGFWKEIRISFKVQVLVSLAIAQAAFWEEEGRNREAADILVDAAQFSLDLMGEVSGVGRYQGAYWISPILQGLARLVEGNGLPSDSRKELSRILKLLDESLPAREVDLESLVETGRAIQTCGGVAGYLDLMGFKERDYTLLWYGNSDRLALVDFFDLAFQGTREAAEPDSRTWPEILAAASRRRKNLLKPRNPIHRALVKVHETLSAGDPPDDSVRQARVRIRLVLAAIVYRDTGVVPDLDDPFGTTIRWSLSERGLTLWSLGRDGVDNGGIGQWQNRGTNEDIVLQLSP